MLSLSGFLRLGGLAVVVGPGALFGEEPFPRFVDSFFDTHCLECHDDVSAKGGLNLLDLDFDPLDPVSLATWAKVHDQVSSGSMPHAADPCVIADGATLWSLGFKTEYESQKLRAINGSGVEILGAFIYPVVKNIPRDRPVFEIVDSRFTAQWGLSIYTAGHHLQVSDKQGNALRETTIKDGRQLGPRFRFDLYSNQ